MSDGAQEDNSSRPEGQSVAMRTPSCIVRVLVLLAVSPCSAWAREETVCKALLRTDQQGENLLKKSAWQPFEQGCDRAGEQFVCDNGERAAGRRGASQSVILNQSEPRPIVASAWSKAVEVSGASDSDYAVYLDITYDDGSELWGRTASFRVGTHDWQRSEVLVYPERPVRSVSVYLLLRGHAGKALLPRPRIARDQRGGEWGHVRRSARRAPPAVHTRKASSFATSLPARISCGCPTWRWEFGSRSKRPRRPVRPSST